MNIQVLMSTYNGEKYVRKQVDSILAQRGVDVSILVRDDGSTDSTRSILEEMRCNESRITCVYEENVGVKKSFLRLVELSSPNADYYAFSDQDDIWLDDKLESAAWRMEGGNQDTPLVYGSPVLLYVNGETTGTRFECPQLGLGNFLIKNYYPGCTMLFNKRMRELINLVDYRALSPTPLHDHWINLVCTACGGKVLMDEEPHILYRQHEGNVVGDRSLLQRIMDSGLLGKKTNTRYAICLELDQHYNALATDDARRTIERVLRYRSSFYDRLKLASDAEVKPVSFIEKIIFFLIVMTGRY